MGRHPSQGGPHDPNSRSGRCWRALSFVTVLSAPAVARADVIGEWNAFAQAQTIPIRPTAHGESRGMAMVEGAVYDAVNALEPDHRPYLLDLQALHAQPFGSQAAAIATAAHDVLVTIVPSGQVGAVHAQRDATLAGDRRRPVQGRGDPCRRRGRGGDARLPPERRVPRGVPVRHRARSRATGVPWVGRSRSRDPRADPDAWVANEKPFLIESPSQFRSNGPNALTSRAYEKDFNEVKSLGRHRQHDPNGGPDRGRGLLAVPADRALEPARA